MNHDVNRTRVRLLITAGLLAVLALAGCSLPGTDNTAQQARATAGVDGYYFYTPRGSRVSTQDTPNCHSFAWQNGSMPTSVPGYGFYDPTPFMTDGSYVEVTAQQAQPGDRVNYGGSYHSAVVEGVDPDGTVWVASYWAGHSDIDHHVRATDPGSPRYFRVADTKYWNTPNVPRRKIALWATMMAKYVCADFWNNTNGGAWDPRAPLWSNRDQAREWETFYILDAGNGKVQLWSYATFSYVTCSANSRAIANGGYPGTAGTFTLESRFGHSLFKSDLNINGWYYYLRSDSLIPQNMYPGTGACFDIIDR
jgi:hypothetical protein